MDATRRSRETPFARTGGARLRGRRPRPAPGSPAGDLAAISLILLAELGCERRLLVSTHKRGHRAGENQGVKQQYRLAEHESLPNDDAGHSEVHGVAHVPVRTADDEPLGGRDGCWRSDTFDRE